MAWIEVHDTLPEHPKVRQAARALRQSVPETVGMLICLWTWALNHREDGVLREMDAEDLARVMRYGGRAQKLRAALVDARLLDALPDGRCRIHDWDEHVSLLMEQRERKRAQARQRQRRRRESLKLQKEAGEEGAPERGNAQGEEAEGERDVTRQVPLCNAATVPYRTLPYQEDDRIDDPDCLPARLRAREIACGKAMDPLLEAEIRERIREGFRQRVGREPQEAELSGLSNVCLSGGMTADMALLAVEQALLYGAQSIAGYACKTLFSWRKNGLYTPEAVRAWERERAGETAAMP